MANEHWQVEPEEHDFPAASSYLGLLCDAAKVEKLVAGLKSAPPSTYLAKDLLRASGLALLEKDNAHVKKDLDKVKSGRKLSPVLLIRGNVAERRPLVVADGYHRICASYWLDENAIIPCRVADFPN